jgi:hypothetical protein
LGEVFVAVEAFVDLVSGSVFSVFDDVFFFLVLVVFAVGVLAGYVGCFSWACHGGILLYPAI